MLKDIHSPSDIRGLSTDELKGLAGEIRRELIDVVSENGGHLASNMGAVELTLALHIAFDAPKDKIVFDVGHQAYVHKMLTGRAQAMRTLRRKDGLSGFPRRDESEYDVNDAGHASDAISLALGLARARDLAGQEHCVVAVVGDGALTGGMCYEALNDAGQSRTKLIVILNDNEMSISPNVGAMHMHLTRMRQSTAYRSFKQGLRRALARLPRLGEKLERALERVRDAVKLLFINDMFFDALNIEYLGPIDGHDVEEMVRVFRRAKEYDKPVVIHVVTRKGLGYTLAENRPERFHGVAPFYADSGKARGAAARSAGSLAAQALAERAKTDSRIVCVSAAMLSGTGMEVFQQAFPDRCFDVGIAEEHAVTLSAGLALGGMKPYAAIYSTFLQRGYDQAMMDVCLNRAPVTFLIDRAGLTGEDGEMHQGVFDLAMLRTMPGMTIGCPVDNAELRRMLELSFELNAPMAIRYPKALPDGADASFALGEWTLEREGADVCLLACGRMVRVARAAAARLEAAGVSAAVVNARFVKPMDEKALTVVAEKGLPVVALEDGVRAGGFGEGVAAWLSARGYAAPVEYVTVPDRFIPQGTVDEQMKMCEMDEESVAARVGRALGREPYADTRR